MVFGAVKVGRLAFALPLAALLVSPTFALITPAEPVTAPPGDVTPPSPQTKLASLIGVELSKRPADASAETLEAFIVFVLSQQDYAPDTVDAALDIVSATPNISDALKTAIANVRLAYAKKKARPGTAAINDGGRGFGGSFSSPGANIGGGSTNYS